MADKSLEDRVSAIEVAISSGLNIDLTQFGEPAEVETEEDTNDGAPR